MDYYYTSLVVGLVALVFIALAAIPASMNVSSILRRRRGEVYTRLKKLYEDEDGTASVESQDKQLTAIPCFILVTSTVAGFLVSTAAAALCTGLQKKHTRFCIRNWISFASWSLLLILTSNVCIERNSIRRYNYGLSGAAAFFMFTVAGCIQNVMTGSQHPEKRHETTQLAFTAVQLACAAVSCLSCLTLPRRPGVFFRGSVVDKERTVSILSRTTFAWADSLLSYVKTNGGLDLVDLPVLHQSARSGYLKRRFESIETKGLLWKDLLFTHAIALTGQSLLSVAQAIISFGPQLAMFKLISLLEQRSVGKAIASEAWLWVFGLGFSIIISSWIEAWLLWVVYAMFALPVRSELSALVFSKSTRRKDVKGFQKTRTNATNAGNGAAGPAFRYPWISKSTKHDQEFDEEEIQKSRQSLINLIGIDAKRVSDFCVFHYLFSQTAAKLTASTCFLVILIGWPSLLAGIAVSLLTLPFNIWASKKYSQAQGDLMKIRDQKMVVVTEALNGIRQIKFSALEQQWQAKIGKKRADELATQWRVFLIDTILISIWILGPVMLSAVSLAVYSVLSGDLSPAIAFTTITVFSQIEVSLAIIPEITAEALEAWVSVKRIGDYLQAPEIETFAIPSKEISFESTSIAWPSDDQLEDSDRFVLRDLNFKLPKGELSVIFGQTGSGKSLLLASILGEVDKLCGTIRIPHPPSKRYDHKANKGDWIISSAIAYVAQIPWIENATIKDNILFGLPLDEARYRKVISSCALEKDLEMLPDGELTDIGANGINLSGGQRWRVTFARALYSRAGILVLDDIFSAVDAHVGRQLFEEALTGDLGVGRTRILVTHHIGLCLPKAEYAISLANGTVLHAGFVEDLQRDGVLDQIVCDEEENKPKDERELGEQLARANDEEDENGLQRVFTNMTGRSFKIDSSGVETTNISQPRKFIEEERREKGHVKFSIWREYLKSSGGWPFWSFVILFFISYEALVLGRSWSIALWTRSYAPEEPKLALATRKNYDTIQTHDIVHDDPSYYLIWYLAISAMICITGTLRFLCVFIGSLRASRTLFEKLSYAVLRAPLRWLDTVPVGRILNRFTADFAVVDSRLAHDTAFTMYNFISLVGIIIAGLFVSPYMLLCALILLVLCLFVSITFMRGAREVKRLESNAKSPIFEQFGSSLAGISTIRAFDKTEEYVENMCIKIDEHAQAFWYMWLFNRWLGFRLNIIGAFFTILVAAVIASATAIDPSLAGFALSFALQYSSAVQWTIRQYTNVELAMNATERIVEYSQIPIEDEIGDSVPAAWPTEGRLEIDGFVAGYADDLPPVLKGLSFVVAKNQRIGVVGRTGAGKSSLTLAIFRFLKAREGCIIVDGIDISKIKLHDLRSRLAIIPQDPVLFSGTVRSNLDAFDERSDAELYDALERVHLIRGTGNASRDERTGLSGPDIFHDVPIPEANTNIFSSLSSRISEGGLNLSQGQRQLLCLARAIVSRPKIMVLDEATSAVDIATDVLIQRSIREEFGDSTLIVIAHRLSTIVDFDSILVMSDGKAVEFDTPKNLMDKKGAFYDMVEQSGERARLEEVILGVDSGYSKDRG